MTRWFIVASVAALALAGTGCRQTRPAPDVSVIPLGGDFTLTDHDGRRFELSSLRGKVVLIFFGYTFCPDVCPTTMSKLGSVYRRLGADATRVQTLYVSVDPERDTPAVLKADMATFSVNATGLTGSKADIDTVVAKFGASYEIVPTPGSAARYTVSHTTWLYAMDGAGRMRMVFPYDATVDDIVEGIRAVLAVAPASPPAPS